MHRLRCQILMPTCTPGSGLRSRREPPSVGRGCHGALLRYQSVSEELAIRIKRIRAAIGSRLALVYGPELSTLSEAERASFWSPLDILTGFESWGRMREDHGLSIEAAGDLWINAIARMLPARKQVESTRD
jgi:hypothetical protein